jgi:hypothetical protein
LETITEEKNAKNFKKFFGTAIWVGVHAGQRRFTQYPAQSSNQGVVKLLGMC